MVSRSLKKAAGQAIQDELSKRYSQGLGSGEIAVTGGHQLKCQYVFHGILTEYNSKTDDSTEVIINPFLMNSLIQIQGAFGKFLAWHHSSTKH